MSTALRNCPTANWLTFLFFFFLSLSQFMHDHHWVSQNPLAVFNTLPPNPSHDALQKAHRFWVEHETRRRVLQAAFILDT